MYQLRAVRLINWHNFTDATLRVDGSCLLMGDNGSGKSTVLDAIQLALVADLNDVKFNRAANEHSKRNVYSYVRGKLGAQSSTDIQYARGSCTGYVILEFASSLGAIEPRFCAGVVVDAQEAENVLEKFHFIVPGTVTNIAAVTTDRRVVTAREFRSAIRGTASAVLADVTTFRNAIRQRLGPLPDTFHRLIVKGLEFRPVDNVKQFVLSYLAEPIPIQTATLLENLSHYRSMEREAEEAEIRIKALDAICETGRKVHETARTLMSHEYMALRAALELAEDALIDNETAQTLRRNERRNCTQDVERHDERLLALDRQLNVLAAALNKDIAWVNKRRFEQDLARVGGDVARAREAERETRALFEAQYETFRALLTSGGLEASPVDDDRLNTTLSPRGALARRDLSAWESRLLAAQERISQTGYVGRGDLGRLEKRDKELRDELTRLDEGRAGYPRTTDALLYLLKTKFGRMRRQPQPICELIDIADEQWRDAIEGFLGPRRFDLVVAPEDYERAASLYEQYRSGVSVPRLGDVELFGVGLVDIERIARLMPSRDRGSLAEKVVVTDPLIEPYVDFVLGRVICCDSVTALRQHRTAITRTVMIYRGFSISRPRREHYQPSVIGAAARARRREAVSMELAQIAEERRVVLEQLSSLQRSLNRVEVARRDLARLPALIDHAVRREDLEREEREIGARLAVLDMSSIAELVGEREALERDIATTRKARDDANAKHAVASDRLKRLEAEVAVLEGRQTIAREELSASFAATNVDVAEFEAAYQAERGLPRSAEDIRNGFGKIRTSYESRLKNQRAELTSLKTRYNTTYGEVATHLSESVGEWETERTEWEQSQLPRFRERMTVARQQATDQLGQHVVARLGESFDALERSFSELNRALKEVPFGGDRYQFVCAPSDELRPFHTLVREVARFEAGRAVGVSSHESTLPAELREELDRMVVRLLQRSPSLAQSELEQLTDYREYYRYDLTIIHADASRSSYDATAGDNSGGETQTPYYIAILASMVQMYRALRPDRKPRCGLVLFDEAFSKMDGSRIEATLRFVDELGLQLILATPKEKVESVARHVGTSLLIERDAAAGTLAVQSFGRGDFEWLGEEREIEGAGA